MDTINDSAGKRQLASREVLVPDASQALWRVVSGALRIDSAPAGEASRFVRLALPGDVIGIEHWAGTHEALSQRAVIASQLVPVDASSAEMMHILMESVVVAHQRCREVVTLRTGPAARRIQALLLLLAQSGAADAATSPMARDVAVPHLADLSDILDVAPETVSRVFGSLRDMALLQDRRPQKARFSSCDLSGLQMLQGMSAGRSGRKLQASLA